MIAVDTNILIYAHREESPFNARAKPLLEKLSSSTGYWAIPWACIHEFLSIVTHPRIYAPPTPTDLAIAQVDAWIQSPSLQLIGETALHHKELATLIKSGRINGGRVHDAKIAAICLQHGVSEFWTADRDFNWFPTLKTRNPLVS